MPSAVLCDSSMGKKGDPAVHTAYWERGCIQVRVQSVRQVHCTNSTLIFG